MKGEIEVARATHGLGRRVGNFPSQVTSCRFESSVSSLRWVSTHNSSEINHQARKALRFQRREREREKNFQGAILFLFESSLQKKNFKLSRHLESANNFVPIFGRVCLFIVIAESNFFHGAARSNPKSADGVPKSADGPSLFPLFFSFSE